MMSNYRNSPSYLNLSQVVISASITESKGFIFASIAESKHFVSFHYL